MQLDKDILLSLSGFLTDTTPKICYLISFHTFLAFKMFLKGSPWHTTSWMVIFFFADYALVTGTGSLFPQLESSTLKSLRTDTASTKIVLAPPLNTHKHTLPSKPCQYAPS
jgi:hypothetical protein